MKKLFLAALFLSQSALATPNAELTLPKSMTCKGVFAVTSGTFSDLKDYQDIKIDKIDAQSMGAEGVANRISLNDDKITFNYGDGGDQYLNYTFVSSDLAALAKGEAKSIRGILEDGFDWTNGYNVRAQIIIECR